MSRRSRKWWTACLKGGSSPSRPKRFTGWRPTRPIRRRSSGSSTQGARADQGDQPAQSEKALQGIGNIPNTTALLGSSVNEKAAAQSWFVPTAKNWVNVENGNILRNMLAQILTGKLSDQAGRAVGRRQHRVRPEHVGPTGTRISLTSSPRPSRPAAAEAPIRWPRRRAAHLGAGAPPGGALLADPPRPGRDHGDPRLPALPARHPLVPAATACRS